MKGFLRAKKIFSIIREREITQTVILGHEKEISE